ncbi:hypothetical protein CLM71_17530 [Serratia sp. MYb239]|uniref:Inhibitor of vertebrate lysozyme n=1 Tax=Serratia rhizosphaerae TaxID=2597702 RepID=A0ABX6GQB8_9GAMM|nr:MULTISPECIES: inhibitor of vertebrate lysozyme family protein [Serratia]AVJ18802.1 hypothetical protein CLM71_17530 [Serratia sp. MYb239]QHA88472.1 hypothetical protein FO014_16690 [Serratia rhizosphaerae]
MTGMHKRRYMLLGALLAVSAGSFAQQVVTTADLVQQPGYQSSWQQMMKGQARLPGWARKGSGTSTPAETIGWQGQQYQVGNICKPHDCGNNFLIVAFKADKSQAWGVRVEVEDRPEAVAHPKKYAKYQWLGKPDSNMQALLRQQFENSPDWK